MPVILRNGKSISQRAELIYNGAHFLKYVGVRMATGLQFGFRQHSYLIQFRLGFFLLWLPVFVLLCQLGVWQLHRYHFKQNMVTLYDARAHAAAIAFLTVADSADLQFQHVSVQGAYLPADNILVQNQVRAGQVGFEVITPFEIPGQQQLLLVDRGWVRSPAQLTQESLASVQSVSGVIKLLNEYQFILGKNILQPNAKPLVLQKIDTVAIGAALHRTVYPFVLRLDVTAEQGFVREWAPVNLNPERHLGYAVQWFLMAIVLCGAYISFCIERVRR
jgi:surfeit locus 1 family protein